jgi:uncharacterized protein YcaQ
MQYVGMLRVVRRERGIRIYSARELGLGPRDAAERRERIDKLIDTVVGIYSPVPGPSLSALVRRLRHAAPQWRNELTEALKRARLRLSNAVVDGVDWYWPAGRELCRKPLDDRVRLLAPFDPVVWDRARFEMLWGWVYRFEAYTPAPKRLRGYYALPLLWRNRVIGWGNLSVKAGELTAELGYVDTPPREKAFRRELEAELDRMRTFLGLES